MESEHRRGERNRRQTGSMYTPAYRVLVSSEFTEGSFIPRQTGIVCASGQTTWTPECQVLVSSKFREGSFIPRQTGIACAGEQQTRVTSAYLATLQTRPNPSTVGLPAPLPPRRVRAPRPQLRRLRGCHAAARLRTTSRTAAPPGPSAPHASGRFQCAPTPLPTPRSTAPLPAPHRIAACEGGMPPPACAPSPTLLPTPAPPKRLQYLQGKGHAGRGANLRS